MAVEHASAYMNDSDEEFIIMDERIREQVAIENYKRQSNNGLKLLKLCASVGRCQICTLKPPCKHRKTID